MEKAAAVYSVLVSMVLRRLPEDLPLRLMITPPGAETEILRWLGEELKGRKFDWRTQCDGDLGDRLREAFATAFADGWDRVGVIGTDCVGFDGQWVGKDLAGGEKDVMGIGPTPDGGYWYLSLGGRKDAVFTAIPWSTEQTYQATLAAAEQSELGLRFLPTVSDIDTIEDLRRVCETEADLAAAVSALGVSLIWEG